MEQQFSFKPTKRKVDSAPSGASVGGSIFSKTNVSNPFKFVATRGNNAADSGTSLQPGAAKSEGLRNEGGFGSGLKAGFLSRQGGSNPNLFGDHSRADAKSIFGSTVSGTGLSLKPPVGKEEKKPASKFKLVKSIADRPELPAKSVEEERASPMMRSRLTAPFAGNANLKWKAEKVEYGSSRESSPRRIKTAEIPPFASRLLQNDRPHTPLTSEQRAVLRSLTELRNRHCPDEYSRYMILDERDKLMYKWRTETEKVAPPSGKKNRDVVGSCNSMCSEKEKYVRNVQKRISAFECDESGEIDEDKLVKEYARSAADQEKPLPHELRKPELLQYTMNYLLTQILDKMPANPEDLGTWYDFLWNRTRAVRKEITQLMLSNELAVSLVESCTRLHIVAAYLLCSLELDKFDPNMNTENLGKCLQTLRHLYEDLAKKGIYCYSEAEFRAFDVMLHLHDSNVLRQVLSYRKEVRESNPVRLAIQLASAMQTKNFVRFFRLIKNEATYLQCCVCHRFFTQVRSQALAVMVSTFPRNSTFEVDKLASILAFDSPQNAIDTLLEFGIRTNDMNTDEIVIDRESFSATVTPSIQTYGWLDAKNTSLLSQTVNGGPIRQVSVVPEVFDSFENGHYSNDPVLEDFLANYSHVKHEGSAVPRSRESTPVDFSQKVPVKSAEAALAEAEARKAKEEADRKAQSRAFLGTTTDGFLNGIVDILTKQIVAKEVTEEKKRYEERNTQLAEERKQRERREEALAVVVKQQEVILDEIVEVQVKKILRQELEGEQRREARLFCEQMCDKVWDTVLMPAMDKKLKNVIKSFLKEEIRAVDKGLHRHKKNLSMLWLRQFWDQWRNRVAAIEESRRQKDTVWSAFQPNWACGSFSLHRYLGNRDSSSSTAPTLDTKQRIALADFRRRRLHGITMKVLVQWKWFTKMRTAQKDATQMMMIHSARKPQPLRRLNSSTARRRQAPQEDSPVRKAARLSLEESFSFPSVSRGMEEMSLSYVDDSYLAEPSLMESTILKGNDLDMARRVVDRMASFFQQTSAPRRPIQQQKVASPVSEETSKQTQSLISDARRRNESSKTLQKRAADLALSAREQQESLERMLKSAISRRQNI